MQSMYTHKKDDSILTVAQAASELGVHADTLRRWANANKVPYFRTPTGHRRFRHTDIEAIKVDAALADSDAMQGKATA
ncbi:helix-turn-helix domain-containing protein [Arthrobacter sp. HLT1-20]